MLRKTGPRSSFFFLSSAVLALLAIPATATAQDGPAAEQQPAPTYQPMRTRMMTSLTAYEISQYLERNDVLFVPVGPTEVNGGSPVDIEYVIPLAYAQELAEKADGLVLPHLAYFYPGGTTTSPATVYVSPSEGLSYLRAITRSLIRQGFRRIVFITSHGPSPATLLPLVREIYDEEHVPVVWISTSEIRGRQQAPATGDPMAAMAAGAEERRNVTFGSYLAVGRLEDIPVGLEQPQVDFERSDALGRLAPFIVGGSGLPVGNLYADPSQHGGWIQSITAEQRAEWAEAGLATLRSHVADYDVNAMLAALADHDRFTRTLEDKYGELIELGN